MAGHFLQYSNHWCRRDRLIPLVIIWIRNVHIEVPGYNERNHMGALLYGPSNDLNGGGFDWDQVAPHNETALVPCRYLEADGVHNVLLAILHRKMRRLLVE